MLTEEKMRDYLSHHSYATLTDLRKKFGNTIKSDLQHISITKLQTCWNIYWKNIPKQSFKLKRMKYYYERNIDTTIIKRFQSKSQMIIEISRQQINKCGFSHYPSDRIQKIFILSTSSIFLLQLRQYAIQQIQRHYNDKIGIFCNICHKKIDPHFTCEKCNLILHECYMIRNCEKDNIIETNKYYCPNCNNYVYKNTHYIGKEQLFNANPKEMREYYRNL